MANFSAFGCQSNSHIYNEESAYFDKGWKSMKNDTLILPEYSFVSAGSLNNTFVTGLTDIFRWEAMLDFYE